MGSNPSGPAFAPSSWQPQWSEPVVPPAPSAPAPSSYRPPRSRRPAVLTALAVGIVALVVAVASIVAHHADQTVAPPPRRTVASPPVTAAKNSIEFTTRDGAGRLTVVDHSWQQARSATGSALEVQIRLECTSGSVEYDPFDFQAFDSGGNLFDLAAGEVQGEMLGVGVLQPGETATGEVAFVMPKGEATLLMSYAADSVTALKIPD